jgi:hypothetical protein
MRSECEGGSQKHENQLAIANWETNSDYPTPPVDLDGIYWSQSLAAGIPTFGTISGTDSRLRVSVGFSPTFPAVRKGHLSMHFQISRASTDMRIHFDSSGLSANGAAGA